MRIIIVGGGASGVVTAIKAKNDNNEVIILENNDQLLKKLQLTGNGRCNYLNEDYSLSNYTSSDSSRIEQLITEKNIWSIKQFFDNIGLIYKIKNGYYYPFTNQASTVRELLINEIKDKNIKVYYNNHVEKIERKDNKFFITTNEREFYSDIVVLATGSYAYPKTGCDGSGYGILKKFGHTIVEPLPALVQLESDFPKSKKWAGVRCDVKLALIENDEVIAEEEGELQLTDYGLSGICIFNLSNIVTRGLHEKKKELISINFVPFVETLIIPWLERYNKKNEYRSIKELLEGFLNKKIVEVIIETSEIDGNMNYSELTVSEKLKLSKYLTAFPIKITGTKGFDNCQICSGGVRLNEIDLDTMESTIVNNLYITGELLDLNGKCGGYNLTTCWISGIIAGETIGDKND